MKEIEVIVVNHLQPLIKKYKLQKNKAEINYFILEGKKEAKLKKGMIWKEFLASIIKTYPSYMNANKGFNTNVCGARKLFHNQKKK